MGTNKYADAKSFEEMAEQAEAPVTQSEDVKTEDNPQVEVNEQTE